ncbi:sulfate transporter CysZ [Thalassotalea marina]|uniref:Sulfate transporter CysZ n=1 Tax=Thalassotalea marina TaxID=1673741 RepID=A0A919BRK2_9GAMM|nr:sulfate transporter CysZ [Thalassotalea marina]GHG06172.1 sulfate transporter CysZ [Thalassotalea marina]
MNENLSKPIAHSGAGYLIAGFKLIRLKGIKRFVFIPLVVNLVLFAIAFSYLFAQLDDWMLAIEQWLPESITWLTMVIEPIAILFTLVMFSFIFSSVTNWIAAPFNGLLAEKLEMILAKQDAPSGSALDIVKDVPRTLSREWCKFKYYLPRAAGFFILYWFIPIIGQVLWFMFLAWMMAIQYKDYAFDNHKVPFDDMKTELANHKGLSYSFGITAAVFSMVPFVNLVIMPVAICGATALWVDHYREQYALKGY